MAELRAAEMGGIVLGRKGVNQGLMQWTGEESFGLRNPDGKKIFPPFRASEGKTVQVPFKGDVEYTIRDILGGIRSTCTYVGAAKLKELSRRTTFIRVTQQVNPSFNDVS